jgi:hypothetical protein
LDQPDMALLRLESVASPTFSPVASPLRRALKKVMMSL